MGGSSRGEVLLEMVAAARGVAAHQPAPPAAGSLLGVAAGVSSHRDIPAIEEEPLVAGIDGLPAGLRCEGLRSPSRSRSGGDGRPRILLACCVAFLRLHRTSCLICTEGYLFISSATAKRKGAGEGGAPGGGPGAWHVVVGAAGGLAHWCSRAEVRTLVEPTEQAGCDQCEGTAHAYADEDQHHQRDNLDCVFPRRTQWRRWQKRGRRWQKRGPSFHTCAAAAVAVMMVLKLLAHVVGVMIGRESCNLVACLARHSVHTNLARRLWRRHGRRRRNRHRRPHGRDEPSHVSIALLPALSDQKPQRGC